MSRKVILGRREFLRFSALAAGTIQQRGRAGVVHIGGLGPGAPHRHSRGERRRERRLRHLGGDRLGELADAVGRSAVRADAQIGELHHLRPRRGLQQLGGPAGQPGDARAHDDRCGVG